jgi:uncharacterized OB-fold protein
MSEPHNSRKTKFIEKEWFSEGKEGPALVASKCDACGNVFFPKKKVCPECFDGNLNEIPLSKKGKLHTYSLAAMGPADLGKPYVMGFIDLPEGIKLYSLIVDCEPWQEVLKIGMDMELVIGKIKTDQNGNDIKGYMFRPATLRK